jgi:superfamily II DNA or RNA helicase
MLQAVVDYKIRLPLERLDEGLRDVLLEALTIPNLEKEKARKLDIWGWQQMPDDIQLYMIDDDDVLIMPRGYASYLVEGLESMGLQIHFEDRRTWKSGFRLGNKPKPRPHQVEAVAALKAAEQGIYKAPTGSGKTVTMLMLIRELGCKALVIVNTKDIMWQWMRRAEEHLGPSFPVGQVGDGKMDISDRLTIATAKTLHSRREQLEADGFFDEFSFVCLDECHHATADTYSALLDRFSARYRFGTSATPDKTGDYALSLNILGPVVHESDFDGMEPVIVRLETDFHFSFQGHKSRFQRSNYPALVSAITDNRKRNELIVKSIMRESGHRCLVLSRRLDHLDTLAFMLEDAGWEWPIHHHRGSTTSSERKEIEAAVTASPCAIFSTLADEALDIPALDRAWLTFPQRNTGGVTQQVGRVLRWHDGKEDAIVYDVCDKLVPVLYGQFRQRRAEVYDTAGWEVVPMKEADL